MIDKVGLISIKNKKILMAQSYGRNKYYIPGGTREPGESDEQTLVREIREELSVDVDPKTLEYFGTYIAQAHGRPEGVLVQVKCYVADYKGELKANEEIEKIDYLGYDRKLDSGIVAHKIFDDLKEKGLIE